MKEPKKMLISNSDIDNICNDYLHRNNINSWFVFCLGIIIPLWFTFITLLNGEWEIFNAVYLTILIIMTFITIILGVINIINHKKRSIKDLIKNQAELESDYTALFIISRIRENSDGKKTIQILLQEKKTWNCDFLPYVDLDKNISIDEQRERLSTELASKLNIRRRDIKIRHLDDEGCYSIKLSIPENSEKLFRYEFYLVSIERYIENELISREKWMDIDLLENNVNMIRKNGDVIENLYRIKSKIIDSFDPYDKTDNIVKIIWNITKQCPFNCEICATYSDKRNELSYDEKSRALLSILTIRDSIKELNFAGGDPFFNDESKKILKYAINLFDRNLISVTTTGSGIDTLNEREKIDLMNNCILTIDSSDFECEGVRNSKEYNKINYRDAKKYRKYISKLRVNVPIVKYDLQESEIKRITDCINEINPEEVSLIKLMPVGKLKYSNYPKGYDVQKFINIFQQYIDNKIKIHLHCALRCEFCDDENCNMLNNKIGIDCEGNVFACCWAGYLDCSINDNPFYIGNILETDLKDIIKSDKVIELNTRIKRKKCNIFLYNENKL